MKITWKMWEEYENQEKQHSNPEKNPHKTTQNNGKTLTYNVEWCKLTT